MKADKRQKFADALKHTRRFRELRGAGRRHSCSQSSPQSGKNSNKENRLHHEEHLPAKALFAEDAASPKMNSSSSSPNSVVASSLDAQQQQQKDRCSLAPPRVSMSETGAEMTLQDDASSSSSFRLSSLRHVSGSTSLLDEAASPPRAPLQPVLNEEEEESENNSKPLFSSPSLVMSRTSSLLTASLYSGNSSSNSNSSPHQTVTRTTTVESPNTPMGLFPCGGGGLECCTRIMAVAANNNNNRSTGDLEWQISQFLESPEHTNSWCHGWQAWSYFQLRQQNQQRGVDVVEEQYQDPVSQETVQRILRHRVTDLAVRRDRLATLRRDLCPFEEDDDDDDNNNPEGQQQRQRLGGRVTSYQPSSNSKTTDLTSRRPHHHHHGGSSHSISRLYQPIWDCGTFDFSMLQAKLPPSPRRTVEIGYDSDPEDFCQRNRRRHGRNSKSSASASKQEEEEQQQRPLAEILQDEDAVRDAVQKFMNGKMTFILHQHGDQPCASHAITAWTERGQNLSKHAIGPRFMWKARHPHSSSANTTTAAAAAAASSSANTTTKKNHSIDLLDVHRILPVTTHLDRSRYPLAKSKHCFWIKTVQTSLLLEAGSTRERDRIVWGFKLAIARLAMKVICSDPSMADEFFLKPTEDYLVPGNKPEWLTN